MGNEATKGEIVSYPYPTNPPIDAAIELISIFRSGSVSENISRIAKAFHILEGYAFNRLFGEPDATEATVKTPPPVESLLASTPSHGAPLVSVGDFCNALQVFVDLVRPDLDGSSTINDNSEAAKLIADRQAIKLNAVPWETILGFLKQYGPILIQLAAAAKGA